MDKSDMTFSKLVSNCISRWRNLEWVICWDITLNGDALMHLSRIPECTRLHFRLSSTLPVSHSSLVFSNLHNMMLQAESLEPISQLLHQARLSAVTVFDAFVDNCPVMPGLTSFLDGVPRSNADHTVEKLRLAQSHYSFRNVLRLEARPLGFEDLGPCMESS